jgi:uncharacterized cofD-like protein
MRPLEEMEAMEAIRLAPAAEARVIRVVAAGGGTGLPRVLAGLAPGVEPEEDRPVQITALVATSDDGGSSGELRRSYGVPAPGDVRNCLVALAAAPNPLAAVFQHRFEGVGGLAGHTVGNVVLTALAQRLGDFGQAVAAAGELLGVRGRVLPASAEPVELVARLDDGRLVRGETAIVRSTGRIEEVRLARPAAAPPEAVEAVLGADLVVLGPGSLYSSVLASLLARGIPEALRATAATRVLVVNLLTQPGETDGYGAARAAWGGGRGEGPAGRDPGRGDRGARGGALRHRPARRGGPRPARPAEARARAAGDRAGEVRGDHAPHRRGRNVVRARRRPVRGGGAPRPHRVRRARRRVG